MNVPVTLRNDTMAVQAFIKMNTPEIRQTLESKGYVNRNLGLDCELSEDTVCTIHEEWILGNVEMQYMPFWIDDDFELVVAPSLGYVDCGTEREKFYSNL